MTLPKFTIGEYKKDFLNLSEIYVAPPNVPINQYKMWSISFHIIPEKEVYISNRKLCLLSGMMSTKKSMKVEIESAPRICITGGHQIAHSILAFQLLLPCSEK